MKAFLILYGSALIPIAISWIWARYTSVESSRKVLRYSAIICAILFFVLFALFAWIDAQCGGNILYGYTDCASVSDGFAARVTNIVFLSTAAGMIYAALLFMFSGILEIIRWARRRK